jgi:2-polyprenyl-3-methyl-5-hydroxy-6-metoxy-1,4-benzoquinol methylase
MGLVNKLKKLLSPAGPGLVVNALRYQYWHRKNQWLYLKHGLALDNECVGDFMPHDIYWAHRSIYDFARRQFPDGEMLRVLDLGCGVGYGSALLAEQPEVATVTALDLDEACIRYAQRHFGNTPGLRFASCAAETFPREHGGPYHFIFSSNVFEHLDDAEALLREIPQHLAPGGSFFFAVPPIFDEEERARQNAVEFHRSNHLVAEWQDLLSGAFGQPGTFYAHRYTPRQAGRSYDATSAPIPSQDLNCTDFSFSPSGLEAQESGDTLTAIWVMGLS